MDLAHRRYHREGMDITYQEVEISLDKRVMNSSSSLLANLQNSSMSRGSSDSGGYDIFCSVLKSAHYDLVVVPEFLHLRDLPEYRV
jgi:hypothetical protein